MKLYSYWRSSAAYRVRIALHLKGLDFETVPVNLLTGEHRAAAHLSRNSLGRVPVLETASGLQTGPLRLSQSLAILELLEQRFPEPALLPAPPEQALLARQAALLIATDIHPINNLGVTQQLEAQFAATPTAKADWMRYWMRSGLLAFLDLISPDDPFCFGESPSWADLCLIPQLYNAHRWQMDFTGLDHLLEIEERCLALDAFQRAAPEAQADATL